MTRAARAALLLLPLSTLGIAVSLSATARNAVGTELARCAEVTADQARLACYDALAGRPASAAAQLPVATAAAGAAQVAPVAQAPVDPIASMGLPVVVPKQQQQMVMQARVAQTDKNQFETSRVTLDNGQVWVSTNGGMLLEPGEAVTIKRAALGAFMLTTASKHSYLIKRVR